MAAAPLSSHSGLNFTSPVDRFELLCACASRRAAAIMQAPSAGVSYEAFDWRAFLELAQHHGVLPLVAESIMPWPQVPAEVKQSLRSAYTANAQRSLRLAAELAVILEHLGKAGVRALPYKGPVLAQSAYGDLALRSFYDLDLLIAPADSDRAKQALAEIGYLPSQALSPAVERLFLRTGYERSFDGALGKNTLELQWSLLPYFYAVDFQAASFTFEDLLARAGHIKLGAAEVPCLAPEDSLLILCLHAAKHLWSRLIWIVDISQSLRAAPIDFPAAAARARSLGIARIVGISLRLTEKLLATDLPSGARTLIARDPEELRLANEFAERLQRTATYDLESTEYFLKIRRLRERPADRWRYLWRLAWTPGPGEVAAIKLPEPLFPLYRAVRIGRLIAKLF